MATLKTHKLPAGQVVTVTMRDQMVSKTSLDAICHFGVNGIARTETATYYVLNVCIIRWKTNMNILDVYNQDELIQIYGSAV